MRSPLVRPESGQNTLSRFVGSTPPGTALFYPSVPVALLPELGMEPAHFRDELPQGRDVVVRRANLLAGHHQALPSVLQALHDSICMLKELLQRLVQCPPPLGFAL